MTATQIRRYSKYIRPISVLTDLVIISILFLFIFKNQNLSTYFLIYLLFSWGIIAVLVGFYKVYRFTKPIEIVTKIIKQAGIFFLTVIAYFPFTEDSFFSERAFFVFISWTLTLVLVSKFLMHYLLKEYRIITGSNYRNTAIIGYSSEAIRLKNLFDTKIEYGYHFLGFFSDKKVNQDIKGKLEDLKLLILNNEVDEIYCSLNELSNANLKNLIEFTEDNNKIIKFIPDSTEIFSKNLKMDYYEFFPVLSLKKTILNDTGIKLFKRSFDIVFSLIVIVTILSWLIPILAFLIKRESEGPVFFKQGRPGIDEKEFFCYKFRSMKVNTITEKEASKNDPRVTSIGKFIRKTSIDETPQFFNVLLGDMSIVGPRPHLWAQNKTYSNKIKKYMDRHCVKPGITGLAQVSGFRGEIESESDMVNRIKLDIFYIENWSFFMDLKIIFQTIVNIFKGEEKAY
jgi:putative colanic acid biosysnthesis UDP-glucose lipid carrier transferase